MGLIDLVIASLCLNATCNHEEGETVISLRRQRLQSLADELSRETLKVATFQNGELSGYTSINGTFVGTGIAFNVIHILQEKYGFNYTIELPEDRVFLSEIRNKGAKNLLDQQKADLVAAFLPIIHAFNNEVTYSRSFDTAEWSVLMNRPKESATGSGLLAPFTTSVWILIIFSILIVGPIIYLLILIQARLCKDDHNQVVPLPACVWFVYGALLKQGSTLNPKTDSSRLLFSTWWLFILILTAFYTANLTAFLTLSQFTLPITTPSDIGKKHQAWVTNKANGIRDVIYSETKQQVFYKKALIEEIGNHDNYPDLQDMSILEEYVTKRNMMFIREKSVINHVMYKDYKDKTRNGVDEVRRCTFVVANFPIMTISRAFAYAKNFKYRELFDDTIQHLVEAGVVQFKLRENLPEAEICPLNLKSTERKLSNKDLQLTYFIVGGGLAVAACVFLMEILWRVWMKRHTRLQRTQRIDLSKWFGNNNYKAKNNKFTIRVVNEGKGQMKNINGTDYWVFKKHDGFRELIPLRTPSSLLFQFAH